jgi:hypothetical protein
MTASTQNDAVSKQTVHLLHPDLAETTTDRGNILLAPTMHAITEARTKNENKGKENRKDLGDKQRTNKNKNRGQTQSGHTEHRK